MEEGQTRTGKDYREDREEVGRKRKRVEIDYSDMKRESERIR